MGPEGSRAEPRRLTDSALLTVSKIPFSSVGHYGDIALGLGNPDLASAVVQACRDGPIPVIVPCHRIVSRRALGGFSSGLIRKEILLAIEGVPYPG